jgi:hypothetical protein
MWSSKDIADYLDTVEYRDNFKFEVHDTDWEGPFIRILIKDKDNFNPDKEIDLGMNSFVCVSSAEEMDRWLVNRLIRIESHEVRERFKRNGKVIFNPHAEGEPYHI